VPSLGINSSTIKADFAKIFQDIMSNINNCKKLISLIERKIKKVSYAGLEPAISRFVV
jgi:pantothenate kinase